MRWKIIWDDLKAEKNSEKHEVSFEEAASVFQNPLAHTSPDDHPHEDRMLLIGHSEQQRLLLVVYVERQDDIYRIISARKATVKERIDYEEGLRS